LDVQMRDYLKNHDPSAADVFMRVLLQYDERGPSLLRRILDLAGKFGLSHLWMYDLKSISKKLEDLGFALVNNLETPSSFFRKDDRFSLHVVATK